MHCNIEIISHKNWYFPNSANFVAHSLIKVPFFYTAQISLELELIEDQTSQTKRQKLFQSYLQMETFCDSAMRIRPCDCSEKSSHLTVSREKLPPNQQNKMQG